MIKRPGQKAQNKRFGAIRTTIMEDESLDGEVDGRENHEKVTEGLVRGKMTGNSTQDDDGDGKPYVGMRFESEEAAKTFYEAYARRVGFSTHVGQYSRTKPDGPIVTWDFSCSREVFRRKNVESCNAILRIERKDSDSWIVTKFVEDHNHSTVSPNKVHYLRPRRHFAGATKNVAETNDAPSDILSSMDGNVISYDPNCGARNASPVETNPSARNIGPVGSVQYIAPSSRKRTLGRDAQNLLNYFKKMQAEGPGFFYAIQLDEENHMTNVFWADARSRTAYSHFGDAVTFDTMYRPNQFQVPFAPFTGLNHHGQLVLFGCSLLLDESESSFTWLFKTWLSAMNDRPPASITTDQDRAIQAAVRHVFPETRHCICKWHILREGQERLSHIYLAHPSFYGELYSCINFSEAVEDFESSWRSLLEKYDLQKNVWLQAVYNARMQWAPVYFRGTFFAALSSNQGVSSFFDAYVNQQTTLPLFFKQYERALENSLEREIEADFDTICTTPLLKTPSPMEQQAANLYTKKVFTKFQEELVETFVYTANKIEGDGIVSKFRVAKYEHDHKAYIVTLNISEMKASCSCQMFEYVGILCRHILTVFTVTNVLTLPPHYILNRWTKNARVPLGSHEQEADAQGIESLTFRFNSLCREAIKYAEEGAAAAETYSAAMSSLRDGAKKIAIVKKNVAKLMPPVSQVSGNSQEDNNKTNPTLFSDTSPPVWPWQETVPLRFNLNDGGIPISDLNQPHLTPVSLGRDGGSSDTVVLTCFKSMTWVIENKTSTPAGKVAVINLKILDLANNNISGTFPHWINMLPELKVIVLRANNFHGTIATSSTNLPFPKLRILDMSDNMFSGMLPFKYLEHFNEMINIDPSDMDMMYMRNSNASELSKDYSITLVVKGVSVQIVKILTLFTTIDLSNNKFEGEVPDSIRRLQSLRYLNLSRNSLTGLIPASLQNLTMLEALDFSSNKLVGEIPKKNMTCSPKHSKASV